MIFRFVGGVGGKSEISQILWGIGVSGSRILGNSIGIISDRGISVRGVGGIWGRGV